MDVVGHRILIIGDSLSHRDPDSGPIVFYVTEGVNRKSTPGDLLGSYLLAAGAAEVRIDARVGRSAWSLFNKENGDKLLADDLAWNPTLVFVMLGANDASHGVDVSSGPMNKIAASFPSAEVWGIGPPYFASRHLRNRAAEVIVMMEDAFCGQFIDSWPLSQGIRGRARDGVHFTAEGSALFAKTLAEEILSSCVESASLNLPKISYSSVGLVGLLWIINRRNMLSAKGIG